MSSSWFLLQRHRNANASHGEATYSHVTSGRLDVSTTLDTSGRIETSIRRVNRCITVTLARLLHRGTRSSCTVGRAGTSHCRTYIGILYPGRRNP